MEIHCPKCLIKKDSGSIFCKKCGATLVDGPISTKPNIPTHLEDDYLEIQTRAYMLFHSGQKVQALEDYKELAKRAPYILNNWLIMGSIYL